MTFVRTAFFFALAAALALFVARRLHIDLGGLWVVLSAVTILRPKLQDALSIAREQVIGVTVGVLLGGLFGSLLHDPIASTAVAVFFTALVCSYGDLRSVRNIACVGAAVVILLPAGTHPYLTAMHRFIDTLIGAAVAILISAASTATDRRLGTST